MELDPDWAYIETEFQRILPKLCEIERQILTLRFGLLESEQARTVDEIGNELGIRRDQILEAERHLLSLIRHPSRSQVIDLYLFSDTFEASNYDDVEEILTRLSCRGIFTSDFEAFFEDIFLINQSDNVIEAIQLHSKYIDKEFASQYDDEFDPAELSGESLYENICAGYFSWSSEFDFLITIALKKWLGKDPYGLEVGHIKFRSNNDAIQWMDKVGFAIALISQVLQVEPLNLALNYMVSASNENYLTGLLPFEARVMLDHESLVEDFLSKNVRVNNELQPHIWKASDKYASDYRRLSRDTESRVFFYFADLIGEIYQIATWGRCLENYFGDK